MRTAGDKSVGFFNSNLNSAYVCVCVCVEAAANWLQQQQKSEKKLT